MFRYISSVATVVAFSCPTLGQGLEGTNARTDGLCRDLARFSCAPGDYNDGTGIARNSSEMESVTRALETRNVPRFKSQFRAALRDPANEDLRKIALSAIGLTYAPHCQSTTQKDQAKCLDDLTLGVAGLAFSQVFAQDRDTLYFKTLGGGGHRAVCRILII